MDNSEIQRFIIREKCTVAEAMQRINENTNGIVFLTDEWDRLIGCVTDGDIRRYLLSGGKMNGNILKAANHSPKAAKTIEEARHLYHKKNYVVIPIIRDDGQIVSLYSSEDGQQHEKPKTPLHIPVVINAGGKGTRLEPFTKVLPKPLIPVGDFPIIEHIMQEYQSYSCNEFHIIVNYKRELLKAYFSENENQYNITWYDEDKPLGTGGGLTLLRGKLNSTFFFANCDALLTTNYESMLRFHKENGNLITMVCAYKNLHIPYGVVEMGINGAIREMKEKPVMSLLTNTGIYIVEPEAIDDMEDGKAIGFPDIIEKKRQEGKKVAVFPISEKDWMDMGQLSELERMRTKLYGE